MKASNTLATAPPEQSPGGADPEAHRCRFKPSQQRSDRARKPVNSEQCCCSKDELPYPQFESPPLGQRISQVIGENFGRPGLVEHVFSGRMVRRMAASFDPSENSRTWIRQRNSPLPLRVDNSTRR